MVDGADKINKITNNAYVNEKDAIQSVVKIEKKPIPIVEKKSDFKFPFCVEETDSETIRFDMPENAPQKASDFIASLIKNKKALMKALDIDSDTYNLLAQTAVGIADTETNFGGTRNRIYKAFRELYIRYERFMRPANTKPIDFSRGVTNLKYTLHVNDKSQPFIKENMFKFGILNEYQLEDPATCAIGTMILLANMNKKIDQSYQEGFKQSQEKYGTSRSDVLCALWNGAYSKALVKGDFDSSKWIYTDNFHHSIEKYKLVTK